MSKRTDPLQTSMLDLLSVGEPITDHATGLIDLRPVLHSLGSGPCFGQAFDNATKRLRDWHGGETRWSGAFAARERVELGRVGKCMAEVILAINGRGQWLHGYRYDLGVQGAGVGPASVWSRVGYTSRDAALRGCAAFLVGIFRHQTGKDASKMLSILEAMP